MNNFQKVDHSGLTKIILDELLEYDKVSGKLFWKKRPQEYFPDVVCGKSKAENIWNTRFSGKEAFTCTSKRGYKKGKIFGTHYLAHRVIWFMVHGEWPDTVDHINGDKIDNRLLNLRSVPHKENMKNQKVRSNNTSGTMGVYWDKVASKWVVQLQTANGQIYAGKFVDKSDAVECRKLLEVVHGYHENHGRVSL